MLLLSWRYVFSKFFRFFLFYAVSLSAFLFLSKMNDVSTMLMNAESKNDFFLFLMHSIPYFFPISSCLALLTASYATARQLSNTNEMTAMRTFGLSTEDLFWPIGIFAIFIAALSFLITHELTPLSRMACQEHLFNAAKKNPLSFFREDAKIGSNSLLLDTYGNGNGSGAENVIIATMDQGKEHMQLMFAKNLLFEDHSILLKDATLVSAKKDGEGDRLFFVERASEATMPIDLSAHFSMPEIDPNHYDFQKSSTLIHKKGVLRINSKSINELSKRSFFPLLCFPLSLLGFYSGTRLSRARSTKSSIAMFFLLTLCLSCFLTAKSFQKSALLSFVFYTGIPLLSLTTYLLSKKRKVNQGSFS